ncbi:MAG: hypothetical protein GY760_03440 [Deltaproteobacteria bacterium]|nr:hypothetical protein [Deltaproteobacteria bacterium]
MDRTSAPNNIDNRYQDEDPAAGKHGTSLTAADRNAIQEEIIHVIEGAGIIPDSKDWSQILKALCKGHGSTFDADLLDGAHKGITMEENTDESIPTVKAVLTFLAQLLNQDVRDTASPSFPAFKTDSISEKTENSGVKISGATFTNPVKFSKNYIGANITYNTAFEALSSWVPNVGDVRNCNGVFRMDANGIKSIIKGLYRASDTIIYIHYLADLDQITAQMKRTSFVTGSTGEIQYLEIESNLNSVL